MKLIELDPRWYLKGGKRVAFSFRCPTDPKWRQLVKLIVLTTKEQWALLGGFDSNECAITQTAKQAACWSIEGDVEAASFSTLTVKPSVDGSDGGLWHGFITNGEIK